MEGRTRGHDVWTERSNGDESEIFSQALRVSRQIFKRRLEGPTIIWFESMIWGGSKTLQNTLSFILLLERKEKKGKRWRFSEASRFEYMITRGANFESEGKVQSILNR